jgi:murein L,D-transpeptidase YcbB/YkuD
VNLERWRWLPRLFESRHLVVNTADATMAVIEDG